MSTRPLLFSRAVYHHIHVCRLIHVTNMARGKRNSNSQKRKKSSKGNDDGENENDDEGKYNVDTVFFVPGYIVINRTDQRKPTCISALFWQHVLKVIIRFLYSCTRIPANSHACGLKTSISRRLTLAGQFLTPD